MCTEIKKCATLWIIDTLKSAVRRWWNHHHVKQGKPTDKKSVAFTHILSACCSSKHSCCFFFYLHLSTHSFFLLLIWIWVTWAQMPRPPSFCNVSKPPVRCNLSFMSWVFFGASLWWDMPEISHLIRCPNLNLPPLDVEEWRLYFESLAISKAELRDRLDGVHFWCLYLQSYSFGQFSQT